MKFLQQMCTKCTQCHETPFYFSVCWDADSNAFHLKIKSKFHKLFALHGEIWVSQWERQWAFFMDLFWGKNHAFPRRTLPLPPEGALGVLHHNYFFILRVFGPNHCSRKFWVKSVVLAFYIIQFGKTLFSIPNSNESICETQNMSFS